MRHLDHLEIAITESGTALLSSMVREFAWGPAQESLLFLDGRVFGRLSGSGWSKNPRLAAASSELAIVSLWPMIDLPSDIEPLLTDFGRMLGHVLTASDVWIVWYERDFDQQSVSESIDDTHEVSEQVQRCVEGLSNAAFIAYSASAARRFLNERNHDHLQDPRAYENAL